MIPGPLVLPAPETGDDLDAISPALAAAFGEIRHAVAEGRAVVVLVAAADLLGQGSPVDAAIATALLGTVRTLAIEGARPGWSINVVATEDDDQEAVERAVSMLTLSGLSGQLIALGTAHLGKVVP
jgi:hypothetical protein